MEHALVGLWWDEASIQANVIRRPALADRLDERDSVRLLNIKIYFLVTVRQLTGHPECPTRDSSKVRFLFLAPDEANEKILHNYLRLTYYFKIVEGVPVPLV